MLRFLLPLVLCCAATTRLTAADDLGVRVPEGFEVSLYADDTLAHDIYSMTLDAEGRVVVAGRDYVKTLHDDDGDGRADRATLYSKVPGSGAHGMYFDGPDLICTGDNSLMRLRDRDGDGTADGKPEIWTRLRHPEHGANGLVRGPDGCYYLICGNDAGVTEQHAAVATSPVKHPRSGTVVRFTADGHPLDIFAHGFRNPYDLDFDAQGHLLAVDSDGERDHHLPWYAPTRLFDVAQGMEHGWLLKGWTRSWNRPASFFDSVERVVEIGRGSPTGVVAYRHRAFPEHYRGGVFAACWTFGRVYFFPLEKLQASCAAPLETFMETTGDVGFAPCDLAVGPAGDLFVAIGGRRTRGSVFRVRYAGGSLPESSDSPLERVLAADQPLSSWSRARWVPLAGTLGRQAFAQAAENKDLPAAWRIRAVEVLIELFDGLDPALAERCVNDPDPNVRARVAWALGRGPESAQSVATIARLTADEDPAVQRYAWEALATTGEIPPAAQPDWSAGLSSPVRRVRAAAIRVAQTVGAASCRDFLARSRIASNAWRLRLAQRWFAFPDSNDELPAVFQPDQWSLCLDAFAAEDADVATRLEAVRLMQRGLGDLHVREDQAEVYCGYVGNATAQVAAAQRQRLAPRQRRHFPAAMMNWIESWPGCWECWRRTIRACWLPSRQSGRPTARSRTTCTI